MVLVVEPRSMTLYDAGIVPPCATYLIVGFAGLINSDVPLTVQSRVLPLAATGPKATGRFLACAWNDVLSTLFATYGVVTGLTQAEGGLAGALVVGFATVWPE